jgi:hypothetical protein
MCNASAALAKLPWLAHGEDLPQVSDVHNGHS